MAWYCRKVKIFKIPIMSHCAHRNLQVPLTRRVESRRYSIGHYPAFSFHACLASYKSPSFSTTATSSWAVGRSVAVRSCYGTEHHSSPAYIFVTNLYIEIICVLLATIWTASTKQMSMNDSSAAGSAFKSVSIRVAGETDVSNTTASYHHEMHDLREHGEGSKGGYYNEGKPERYVP